VKVGGRLPSRADADSPPRQLFRGRIPLGIASRSRPGCYSAPCRCSERTREPDLATCRWSERAREPDLETCRWSERAREPDAETEGGSRVRSPHQAGSAVPSALWSAKTLPEFVGRDIVPRRPRPRQSGRNELPEAIASSSACAADHGADVAARRLTTVVQGRNTRHSSCEKSLAIHERVARTKPAARLQIPAGLLTSRKLQPSIQIAP